MARTSGSVALACSTVKNFRAFAFTMTGLRFRGGSFRGPGGRGGGRLGLLDPDRLDDQFGGGDGGRVERRLAPGDLQRQLGVIDDAAVAAEAALVVRRTHENAIDRAGIDTQRAEHALGVV